jgi:diguanylate cyclase (GGDEF)-like protein
VALFDLDHFKSVNDAFGHAAGDAVLRHFCSAARDTMRATDRFARYGGEEFVLLMPVGTDAAAGTQATERIRAATEAQDWRAVLGGRDHVVTVSAGIATWRPDESLESVLARADVALYAAKSQGRNRCTLAELAAATPVDC